MNAKPTALDAYLARTAAIHAKLERLQQLADDHFGHDREKWGKRGTNGVKIDWYRGACSRGSARNPRQCWRGGQEKTQPIRVGF